MKRKKDGFINERAIIVSPDVKAREEANELTQLLYITDVGHYPQAIGHYRQRNEGIDQNILIYCCDGEGWYDIGNGKNEVHKNEFFIIENHLPHVYAASDDNPWSIYWIHFTGSKSHLFKSMFNRTIHIDDNPLARFDDRIMMFNEIIENFEMGFSRDNLEYITLCLWHLLGSFRYIPQFREVNKPKPVDAIQKVISYMKGNLDGTLSLDDMAHFVHYSASYLSTVFAQKTGLPPIAYFNQLKIQKACRLLDFTDMKVKEIAFELSFSDQYYFSKVFTKYMKMSPVGYRKKRKG
jgi:AraC-like DNA-binding protein